MKNSSRTHWESKNGLFFPKFYSTNTLGIKVYKIINCHKDPMPCILHKTPNFGIYGFLGPLKKQVSK
jgi:hypothetical protein